MPKTDIKYGKIICGTLQVPQNYPSYIVIEGQKIYHPSVYEYTKAGYLPIVETEYEEREGYTADAVYREEDGKIIQEWRYTVAEDVREETEETNNNEEISDTL